MKMTLIENKIQILFQNESISSLYKMYSASTEQNKLKKIDLNISRYVVIIIIMSSTVAKTKNFQASNIGYDDVAVNSRGGKSVKLKYKDGPFRFQTPIMKTWGVTRRLDDNEVNTKGFDFNLRFDGDSSKIRKFKEQIEEIQEQVLSDAIKHSKEWFGKKYTESKREVLEDKMGKMLRYPKKKDDSGEFDYSRAPTLRVKLRYWDGEFNKSMNLFKMQRGNPEPLHDFTPAELVENIEDLIPAHSEMCCVVTFQKIWFVNGNFGITVVLDQATVKRAEPYVNKCLIVMDSDDEEELERMENGTEQTGGKAKVEVVDDEEEEVVEDDEEVVVEDDDDDIKLSDDEVEAEVEVEEEEVVVEKPKKKKKKILKKKNKKGSSD